jgi:hypothetical protein
MNRMSDRMSALGEYINKGLGRKINFKGIKMHPIYRDALFSFGTDDYIVGEKASEVNGIAFELSTKRGEDYPPKLAKKYTHKKYQKAKEKKAEEIVFKGKKYFIIKL